MKRNQTFVQNVSAYERSVHLQGRVWDSMALALMLMAPIAICIYFDAWPPLTAVLKALLGVAPMYWTVGVIEVTWPTDSAIGSEPYFRTLARSAACSVVNCPVIEALPPLIGSLKYGEL